MARWNLHLSVVEGWWPRGFRRPAAASYLHARPHTCGALVDQVADRMYVTLTRTQRTAICRFLDHAPGDPLGVHDAALHWRLPYVVALVLDAPDHGRR